MEEDITATWPQPAGLGNGFANVGAGEIWKVAREKTE
jgi:hypothetical protein